MNRIVIFMLLAFISCSKPIKVTIVYRECTETPNDGVVAKNYNSILQDSTGVRFKSYRDLGNVGDTFYYDPSN